MMPPDPAPLIAAARAARERAYAPYSHFQVGAAVLTGDGQIYTGCNIETASYGLTICAERVALFTAVAAGAHDFRAIAVVAGEDAPWAPCGGCRQVMQELGPAMVVVLATADSTIPSVQTTIGDLLPLPFIYPSET
jgi:cytidine deaminase